MAFEEDASIAAFARMRVELAALGAPVELVSAAERAEGDETRHQRTMAKLARALGAEEGEMPRFCRPLRIGRRAAAVAAENAAEGCVRETYGALVNRWQSLHAEDVRVRRTFARVALDEARHAALSWAIAGWIESKLDAAGQKRVARSRARAVLSLRRRVSTEPSSELIRAAGLPSAAKARVLLDAMLRELTLIHSEKSDV